MSNPYISNSDIYQVNAERDISVILSRFNTNFIYDCIESAIESKNNAQFIIPNPNLVRSLEDTFIMMQQNYPDDRQNILACREETYLEIINYLCGKYNLSFNNNDENEIDLYSTAYYLYDFLVGNYLHNLTLFFSKYILHEKNNLYKAFNLDKFKKTTNINYGKKMVKDHVMSTILIQISYVIDQMMTFDFDFRTIVNIIYDNNHIAQFINLFFSDNNYFFDLYKKDINNVYIRPNIITNIRLLLQPNGISDDAINTFIKDE